MNKTKQDKQRALGIGGSEVDSVFNLEPYGCARRLWYQKRGVEADYAESYNPHFERGIFLEPIAAKLFAKKHPEYKLKRTHFKRQSTHDFMQGSGNDFMQGACDRIIERGGGDGILEIKCPARDNFFKIKKEALPYSWILQLQHYLYLYDKAWGAYAVFNADLWDLVDFEVARDNELIKIIIAREEKFWHSVEFGPAPEVLDFGDNRCRGCRWAKSCWGVDMVSSKEVIGTLPDYSEDMSLIVEMQNYEQFSEKIKIAESQKEEAREAIKKFLCEKQVTAAKFRDKKITYTEIIQQRFDTKRFEIERPEIFEKYKKPVAVSTLRILKG